MQLLWMTYGGVMTRNSRPRLHEELREVVRGRSEGAWCLGWRWMRWMGTTGWMVLFLWAGIGPASGQEMTQEIVLRPGWNAVFLEVEPADRRVSAVFAGVPVASVWTRVERVSSAGFVRNQNEAAWNEPGWLVYLPSTHPDAYLTTLRSVAVNRAYLVQVEGTATVTWRVTGRPSLKHPAWVPDALNLRGFPVDPERPATFGNFFRGTGAHASATGVLEEMYRLEADGRWRRVQASEVMRSGEALWVYSRGASTFVAPLTVGVEAGDGLDFDLLVDALTLRFGHRETSGRTVSVAAPGQAVGAPLAYWDEDFAEGRVAWTPLPAVWTRALVGGGPEVLRLAVRRQQLTAEAYGEVLRVTDGVGTRHLVPVGARRSGTEGRSLLGQTGGQGLLPAGVWMGALRVTAVAEVHGEDPDEPRPVKSAFPMRVILHVDGEGRTRLLKEVIQMWEDGEYREVGGVQELVEPGRVVWVTDPRLVSRYQGVTLRDGVSVGRRLSSVGFDFDGGAEQVLLLTGRAAVGEKLTGAITLGSAFPTNPFLHRYHPDHDNLDERFGVFREEAYAVTRSLEFEVMAEDPTGFSAADYGYGVVGGVYRETLTGIHHRPVRLRGDFRLRRISDDPVLNPSPRVE